MNSNNPPMKIWTNADVDTTAFLLDRDGNILDIDPGSYKCDLKKTRNDAVAVLIFETAGASNQGDISLTTGDIDGVTVDMFRFRADQSLVADLEPGNYFADMIRINAGPVWTFGFEVQVEKGITDQ